MDLNFTSPGANATNAIQEFLIKRALQERQARMDALAQQQQGVENQRSGDELKLRQSQEARIAAAQQETIKDAENQRNFSRATTISENAMPGDAADEQTRKLLEAHGLGGQLKKIPGVVSQGALQGTDDNGIPQYDVNQTPDSYQMRGGSKYLAARTAADERAAEGEKTRQATAERGDADRQMREEIARMAASGNAAQRDLANQLTQLRIDQERNKADAATQAKTDAAGAVKTSRSEVRDLAQSLLSDPALEGITGPVSGRRDTFFEGTAVDAKKRLDQLVGKLSLQARGSMKGQGQISDFEGRLLSNAVSAIDRGAGSAEVKKHLQEIVDAFAGDAPNSGPSNNTAHAGGSSFKVVGVR